MFTEVLLGQWCANMAGRQQRWLLSQVYLYGLTSLNRTRGQEKEWPWRMIWKPKVPYKVKCFTWFLEQQVVLTHENLNKRGHQLASRVTCVENKLRQSTIFSYIVNGQNNYGECSLAWRGSGGWNQDALEEYLVAGSGMEMLQRRRRDGRLSQHAFGGQSRKRETIGALKMYKTVFRMSKWKVSSSILLLV